MSRNNRAGWFSWGLMVGSGFLFAYAFEWDMNHWYRMPTMISSPIFAATMLIRGIAKFSDPC